MIALVKSSVRPSAKWEHDYGQLKGIVYKKSAPNRVRYCNALKYELSLLSCSTMVCGGGGGGEDVQF